MYQGKKWPVSHGWNILSYTVFVFSYHLHLKLEFFVTLHAVYIDF